MTLILVILLILILLGGIPACRARGDCGNASVGVISLVLLVLVVALLLRLGGVWI